MSGTIVQQPRFLHEYSQFGYTDHPSHGLRFEPQALYEEEQAEITLRARSAFAEARRDETERRDNHRWLERLRKAEMTAFDRGIDVFRFQAKIRREILGMEHKIEQPHSVRPVGTI